MITFMPSGISYIQEKAACGHVAGVTHLAQARPCAAKAAVGPETTSRKRNASLEKNLSRISSRAVPTRTLLSDYNQE